jgi:hypothetical protein
MLRTVPIGDCADLYYPFISIYPKLAGWNTKKSVEGSEHQYR